MNSRDLSRRLHKAWSGAIVITSAFSIGNDNSKGFEEEIVTTSSEVQPTNHMPLLSSYLRSLLTSAAAAKDLVPEKTIKPSKDQSCPMDANSTPVRTIICVELTGRCSRRPFVQLFN
ncbi:hypothetical protein Nepgr_004684 [Nepenthes gracilis]|uniref:Uncharacterized protein n=1 Tax=Nepenthes gracilis TaxID=150966 RepID=A0AAD3S1U9_NEPGR|nr:hypothetical protein Nepgr_004684 [Nepenthes gracilis]